MIWILWILGIILSVVFSVVIGSLLIKSINKRIQFVSDRFSEKDVEALFIPGLGLFFCCILIVVYIWNCLLVGVRSKLCRIGLKLSGLSEER